MAIHPDAAKVVELIIASGRPPYPTIGHVAAREIFVASRAILQPDPSPVAEVRDLAATGPAGKIPLRLYRGQGSDTKSPQPALIYYHGGGWVLGNLDSHDGVCRDIANVAQCTVISVDYRLAPEAKFPAAADDAIAAAQWIHDNAADLGIDRGRLAVGGDSAGGNLSAVVALYARDNGNAPKLKLQVLIYPSADMSSVYPSYEEFAEQLPLTRTTMDWFVDLYLSDREKDAKDWRASPLHAKRLASLPPAFIITAAMDPLRDEGEAFARALIKAGVPVEVKRFDGQIHGFLTMGRIIKDSQAAIADIATELRKAFA
ncbi:alpha/beta hydrolase [Hyphomicrobium sp. CS1BSMeth3]|uniref:alpha/beta hydrolase n=1 Tax=Hyphomicrobium sp. CS1BSMeth3 TaxID=1892844 RepID=UPI000931C5A9|nr:alpha/beta hydrolase [Hyphomicrobium sp. CS1BSMeth3]